LSWHIFVCFGCARSSGTFIIFDILMTITKSFVPLKHTCTWHTICPVSLSIRKHSVGVLFNLTKNCMATRCSTFELSIFTTHGKNTTSSNAV
jgi:protein tyrosine phosphatase